MLIVTKVNSIEISVQQNHGSTLEEDMMDFKFPRSQTLFLWRVAPNAIRRRALLLMVLALLAIASSALDVHARGRGRSSARQAAAARKQQLIKVLQQQLTVARQVLAAAESKQSMSSHEVNQAISQLSDLRTSIDEAQVDAREAAKTLHEIEAEILAQQSANSDVVKSEAVLAQAKTRLHAAIHQVIALPDDFDKPAESARLGDLAKMTDEDRKRLDNHDEYLKAKRELTDATRRLSHSKKVLLEQDADWVAARDQLREAEQTAQRGKQQATTVGVGSLDARQDLRKSQAVASTAREMIGQLEFRLRQLRSTGVSATPPMTRR